MATLFCVSFKRKTRKNVESLRFIMSSEKDLLLEALSFFGSGESEMAKKLSSFDYKSLSTETAAEGLLILQGATKELSAIMASSKKNAYFEGISLLNENEKQLRRTIANYNFAAMGMRYWVAFPLCGWLLRLWGFGAYENLN